MANPSTVSSRLLELEEEEDRPGSAGSATDPRELPAWSCDWSVRDSPLVVSLASCEEESARGLEFSPPLKLSTTM